MKFIRVYSGNFKNDEYGYFLLNVNNIQNIYLEKDAEIKGKKRIVVCYVNRPSGSDMTADYEISYYLGKYQDKASYWCWLDSNIAEELYEELEMMLNKE